MATSGRIVDYLGKGLASARPASLTLTTGAVGVYFATDTSALSLWTGAAWVAYGGGGIVNKNIVTFIDGKQLTATEILAVLVIPSAANFATSGHYAIARVASTAGKVFALQKNGTSVGTVTWTASNTTGAVAFTSSTSFIAGDTLSIVGDTTADTTLEDISITLIGT